MPELPMMMVDSSSHVVAIGCDLYMRAFYSLANHLTPNKEEEARDREGGSERESLHTL